MLGPVFDKANAAAETFLSNFPTQTLPNFFRGRLKEIIVGDVIGKLQSLTIGPSATYLFTVRQSMPPILPVPAIRQGVPVVAEVASMTFMSITPSPLLKSTAPGLLKIDGNQGDLTKTLGEVGGFKNSAEIKQKNNINSIIGVTDPVGIINRGEIEQKGILNLQLGIGSKFGIVNFGQIKSTGTSIVQGFGLAFGVFNAGTVKLVGENSRIIGGGVLNGIWNLGELQTSNKSDIVAGISGGVGIVNGFDLNPSLYTDTLPKTLKVLQAAAAASEINTKEGDDLIYGGGLFNVNEFLSKLPNIPEFTSQFLADILLTKPSSKDASIGILNFGKINTGLGNDVVFGAGDDITSPETMEFLSAAGIGSIGSGIINAKTGIINLGDGDDLMVGEIWAVNPPNGGESPRAGIVNYGLIKTGDGNDHICGFSGITAPANKGIFNDGTIITGFGNDFIDALTGGFSGTGLTDLGHGDDTLVGFGSGRFDGGSGTKDKLLLADGSYAFAGFGPLGNEPDAAGYFKLTSGSDTMLIKNFELIGSAANPFNAIQFNLGGVYNITDSVVDFLPLLFVPLGAMQTHFAIK